MLILQSLPWTWDFRVLRDYNGIMVKNLKDDGLLVMKYSPQSSSTFGKLPLDSLSGKTKGMFPLIFSPFLTIPKWYDDLNIVIIVNFRSKPLTDIKGLTQGRLYQVRGPSHKGLYGPPQTTTFLFYDIPTFSATFRMCGPQSKAKGGVLSTKYLASI